MTVFSLTYVSSASGLYSRDIFRSIALTSSQFNHPHGITGMLLVYNETIIQFLEGPEDAVRTLFNKIEQDPRHKSPIVVSTRTLDAPEFPNWSMGYRELITDEDPSFIFGLNLKSLDGRFPGQVSRTTKALVSSFKRSSGLVAAPIK